MDVDEIGFMAGLGFPPEYPVHHPGYALWVGLGTVLHWLGLPPYVAFQTWSMAASVAAPLLLFVGLRWILDTTLAWWIAMAYGVCPLVWFLGTTALSYMLGGAAGLAIVGCCYQATRRRRPGPLWAAGVVLVAASALRSDLMIYLGPLVLWTAWKLGRRPLATATFLLAAGVVLNGLIVALLYGRTAGGPATPSLQHTIDVILGTSVFKLGPVDGLARNLVKIALNLGWNLGVAVIALPICVLIVWRRRRMLPPGISAILILWAGPCLLFLAMMHVVQGYFVLLLAAGYAVLGLGLQAVSSPARRNACAAATVAMSVIQFLAYPWSPDATGLPRLLNAKIAYLSRAGLMQIDRRSEIHTPGDTWRTAAHGKQSSLPAASQAAASD